MPMVYLGVHSTAMDIEAFVQVFLNGGTYGDARSTHPSTVFFFNDTATTEIYTLSLHDALPICGDGEAGRHRQAGVGHLRQPGALPAEEVAQGRVPLPEEPDPLRSCPLRGRLLRRSEEHTSELQSRRDLGCRLLLEKKKTPKKPI